MTDKHAPHASPAQGAVSKLEGVVSGVRQVWDWLARKEAEDGLPSTPADPSPPGRGDPSRLAGGDPSRRARDDASFPSSRSAASDASPRTSGGPCRKVAAKGWRCADDDGHGGGCTLEEGPPR